MFSDHGSITIDLDGEYVVTTHGGSCVYFVIDQVPDPLKFESTVPDAALQKHERQLNLTAGQVVTTFPAGQPLTVEPWPPLPQPPLWSSCRRRWGF
jgi:hypothetical protein